MEHIVTSIIGMHCAACAQNIEKALNKTKGVSNVNVNFTSEHATISYDETITDEKKIFRVIEKLGYVAELNKPENELQRERRKLTKKWFIKLLVCTLLGIYVIGVPILTNRITVMSEIISSFIKLDINLFLVSVLVVYIGNFEIIKTAVKSIIKLKNDKAILPSLGILILFIYSAILTFFPHISPGISRLFIYSALVLISLILTLEKFISLKLDKKINEYKEKLINLKSSKALVIRHDNEVDIDLKQVKIGDLIKIEPGQVIPVDGIIVEGKTTINEMVLTGSNPSVEKNPGDEVISATINISGPIVYKALQVGKSTTLAQALHILHETRKQKGFFEKFGSRMSAIFTVIIFAAAVATFSSWLYFGGSLFSAIITSSSILLIANPFIFHLGSKAPMTMGLSRAALNGILFKGGRTLEETNKIDRIVFDKTGTLTHGIPEITNVISREGFNEKRLLIAICSLEHASLHPFGDAIVEYCKSKKITMKKVYDFKNIEGQGIMGTVDGQEIIAGNMKFMEASGVQMHKELLHKAEIMSKNIRTPIYIARNRELMGIIGVADSLKESAKAAIQMLDKRGYKLTLITGDNKNIAQNIADILRIRDVIADVRQKEKIEAIHQYQNKNEITAFVGDGINDAPVLAKAHIGMAIGTGTDTALEASDITFISDNLHNVHQALSYASSITKVIKQNYIFSFLYLVFGIAIASGAYTPYFNFIMHPSIAPLAMLISLLLVMKNSLRFKKYIARAKPKGISDFHSHR